MAIVNRYVDWRWLAAKKITIAATFTVDPILGTIFRSAGSFIADGVQAGMTAMPKGSSFVDAYRYPITLVTASTLIFTPILGASGDGPEAFTLVVYQAANDGYEEFPGLTAGQAGRSNLVRAGGFNGGFSVPSTYTVGVTSVVSVNGLAADAVPGVPEYDWYLSQRTDDPAKKYLSIVEHAGDTFVSGNTYSGTVDVNETSVAFAELAISSGDLTVDQITQLFKFCHLYCRRRSDGAIQWVDLLRAAIKAA